MTDENVVGHTSPIHLSKIVSNTQPSATHAAPRMRRARKESKRQKNTIDDLAHRFENSSIALRDLMKEICNI
jgi:hypothetical protein